MAVVVLAGPACSSSTETPGPGTGASSPEPAGTPTTAVVGELAPLPLARTEVAGAFWDGKVVVAGGLTLDGGASDRVDLYLPGADRWEPGVALPVALHHLGLAVLGERLYAVGGYTNPPGRDWQVRADVWSLGPGERAWRAEVAMSRPRGAQGTAVAGGRLVVAGGVTGGLTGTSESWAPGEPAWRPGPDLAQAREHLGMASLGGRAYAIGGRLGGFDSNLRTVESWAPGEAAWRAEPMLADTRGGTAATEVAGRLCVAGGEETQGTIASVECLVPAQGRWERLAPLAQPRHGLAVVGVGPNVHFIGGGPQPGLFVSTAHEVQAG
ncbi:MAG: galactose oxidase [Actinomycetota bacterium]